jgi:hypothetical protein
MSTDNETTKVAQASESVGLIMGEVVERLALDGSMSNHDLALRLFTLSHETDVHVGLVTSLAVQHASNMLTIMAMAHPDVIIDPDGTGMILSFSWQTGRLRPERTIDEVASFYQRICNAGDEFVDVLIESGSTLMLDFLDVAVRTIALQLELSGPEITAVLEEVAKRYQEEM